MVTWEATALPLGYTRKIIAIFIIIFDELIVEKENRNSAWKYKKMNDKTLMV
jgi:hypothetical protein